MKKPTLFQMLCLCGGLTILSAPMYFLFHFFFGPSAAVPAMFLALGGGYLAYLLSHSKQKAGKVSLAVGYLAVALLLFVFGSSVLDALIVVTGSIWFARSALFHRSMLSAGIDFFVSSLSAASGVSMYLASGSFVAGIFAFFFVHALSVFIPDDWSHKSCSSKAAKPDRFSRAHRAAQDALREVIQQA